MSARIDIDLRPELSPIRDQGRRPTCLAHALTVAHERARRSSVQLSPEYLHHFASQGGSGARLPDAARAIEVEGQPAEQECPYAPDDPPAGWRPAPPTGTFRRAAMVAPWRREAIGDALRSGDLPILAITLPEPFFKPTWPWLIDGRGTVRGRHAVAAVGMGRLGRSDVVLIRNSWGDSWGDHGYAWVSDVFLATHGLALMLLGGEVI